jgi:hypothetical protein
MLCRQGSSIANGFTFKYHVSVAVDGCENRFAPMQASVRDRGRGQVLRFHFVYRNVRMRTH